MYISAEQIWPHLFSLITVLQSLIYQATQYLGALITFLLFYEQDEVDVDQSIETSVPLSSVFVLPLGKLIERQQLMVLDQRLAYNLVVAASSEGKDIGTLVVLRSGDALKVPADLFYWLFLFVVYPSFQQLHCGKVYRLIYLLHSSDIDIFNVVLY